MCVNGVWFTLGDVCLIYQTGIVMPTFWSVESTTWVNKYKSSVGGLVWCRALKSGHSGHDSASRHLNTWGEARHTGARVWLGPFCQAVITLSGGVTMISESWGCVGLQGACASGSTISTDDGISIWCSPSLLLLHAVSPTLSAVLFALVSLHNFECGIQEY